jgi:Na+/H+ antiporter NhaD/arsenite permease-like protein
MVARLRMIGVGLAVKFTDEPFFLITLAATAAVSAFTVPNLAAIHWDVISILFSQMLVCAAFEDCRLLSCAAEMTLKKFATPKKLAFAMVLITGLMSMLVTNDIALLTVVPLTLGIARLTGKDPFKLVILETMSANIFSAATPFGNPQNLYLYAYYHIAPLRFFQIMLPFCALGLVLLSILTAVLNGGEAFRPLPGRTELRNKKLLTGAGLAFLMNLLAVLRVVDYRLSLAVTIGIFLLLSPHLIRQVDYVLLLTFVLFFVFSNSITAIPAIKGLLSSLLRTPYHVLAVSAAVSQIISNVPAAVLLSGFTACDRELLYGVSAGGLGTLIASLASLISYKLYAAEYRTANYLRLFLVLNFTALAVLTAGLLLLTAVTGS